MRSASRLRPLALGTLVSVSLASTVKAAERVPLSVIEHVSLILLATAGVAVVVVIGTWAFRN
jgi:hypothetical protein